MHGAAVYDCRASQGPCALSFEANSESDARNDLPDPNTLYPSLCHGVLPHAREIVLSVVQCSISLIYAVAPETRSLASLNVPLCVAVFLCSILTLWPRVRRNEPLRQTLLTIGHCLSMVSSVSLYWRIFGSPPQSAQIYPCLTPALQFLFANMGFSLRYQLLPTIATTALPFISFPSEFTRPLPITLMVGSIILSFICSAASRFQMALVPVSSADPKSLSATPSSLSHRKFRPASNLLLDCSSNSVALHQSSAPLKFCRKSQRALKMEDAKSSCVLVDIDTQPDTKITTVLDGDVSSINLPFSFICANTESPLCSQTNPERAFSVVEIENPLRQYEDSPTSPPAASAEHACCTSDAQRKTLQVPESLVPQKRNDSFTAQSPQLGIPDESVCAKEWRAQYESLKEAYDFLRSEKERDEAELVQQREQIREEQEKHALMKAVIDQNQQDTNHFDETIAGLNEQIRTIVAERSVLKGLLERNNEFSKQAEDTHIEQSQQASELKVKYDLLKEAFDIGAEAQKLAEDAKLKQDSRLEEMAQKYQILKASTDRDVSEWDKAKEQNADFSRQNQEAQIKYSVLKEAYDKNIAVRRVTEDESAKYCQERNEMKARYDMLKEQFDTEMDLKRTNDAFREQQAQDFSQANAEFEHMKKSFDIQAELGQTKDERIAEQDEQNRELKTKYELLKATFDSDNIPRTDMERHNLELCEQVRELTMKYSVLKQSFDERSADKKDVDAKLLDQIAQTMQMSANYSALKKNFDRGEKHQKMTDDALLALRQQLDNIAAENKVLKVAFENSIGERNRAKETIALQSARALEMNSKYALMKESADRNDELRKKAEDQNADLHRAGCEMKVRFDLMKESYDTELVEKANTDVLRAAQNQEAREAKVRYGILKKSYDDELKYKREHEIDGVDRKRRMNEMEIKYEMMKTMADEGVANKRKFDADYGKHKADIQEMKVKYDMLKGAFDDGAKEQKAMQDDFNAQGESLREMKRKYGVLKVHFDKSVEDADADKKLLAEQVEEGKRMKVKYDTMKKQVNTDLVWKSKAECDLRLQTEETRRVEQVLSNTRTKLEKKTQECAKQEETLTQAASQFKVIGWMNNAANTEDLEAVPDLLPPLMSLNNNTETQSQISATQSNLMDDVSSFSNISHDVRTPLTTAISSIGILLDEKVKLTEADRHDLLSKAYGSLQSVLNLVNNILDFEKLRAKSVVPQLKQVNIRRLLISQIRTIEAQSPSTEFNLEVSSSVPTAMMIDRLLFQRVMLNLFENAARSSSDSAAVASSIRWDDTKEELSGVVVNRGDGLSVSERGSVFSMSEGTLGMGGASLRLAVCHQLLAEMGGQLTVTSSGKRAGTIFEFHLPAPKARNIANTLDISSLVIDDDPLRRRATMEMCRYAGVNVLPESTLAAAKDNNVSPAVVFATVDCSTWVETVHYWRKQNVGVCMVIPTQLMDKGYHSFPAEAYLRSPIDIVELREVLQKFCAGECQLSDSSTHHPSSSRVTSIGHSSVKGADVPMLLVEDTPVNHSLFLKQLTNMGFTNVHSAFNGADAVRLAEANSYALIIMDCFMPMMDGFEATRKIREIPAHATTPIVAVTADHSSENIRKCRESGMTDFFTKPVTHQTWKTITAIAAKRASFLQLSSLPCA